ncbi:MAG: nucleotidyltransferase family protein [Chloroflexaceae bacterium]|nr:nucleotidyltransferase family protein [Chloroflexaceae bacterium]
MIATAASHDIAPLLYQSLNTTCATCVPPHYLAELRNLFLENAIRNLALTQELWRLLELLEKHRIPVIPYKGTRLAERLYGNCALRPSCDIDLIVPKDQVLAVRSLLMANGYERGQRFTWAQEQELLKFGKAITFRPVDGRQASLDLHWHVASPHYPMPLSIEGFWERLESVCWRGQAIAQFPCEDLLLLLCLHGIQHQWQCLKWICDLHQLLQVYPQLQWESLWQRADALGIKRIVLVGLLLTRHLLETELPDAVLSQAAQDPLAQTRAATIGDRLFAEERSGLVERWIDTMSGLGGNLPEKLRYVLPKIFFLNGGDLAFLSLPRSLFFLYYLLRPIRILLTYPLNPWRMLKLLGQLFR